MDNKRQMNKEEYLKAMSDAIKRRYGEETEQTPEGVRRPPSDFIMPKVGPGKVDPQREAEAMMLHRIQNKINPETGMPFYSEPEEVEEDPQAAQQREIRMQMLREAAKTGKMPEYLKKY